MGWGAESAGRGFVPVLVGCGVPCPRVGEGAVRYGGVVLCGGLPVCGEGHSVQVPYFRPYSIIRIDGSRIHVRCTPHLGSELLCAPKQLRHYHSPDDLSWDEWRLSNSQVERIDLENAASPDEADELEEKTADGIPVNGYYVVVGIARHKFKQGWNFLTLWDGYGLSEATSEPMSACIQPDGSVNPIFCSYLVENNEG